MIITALCGLSLAVTSATGDIHLISATGVVCLIRLLTLHMLLGRSALRVRSIAQGQRDPGAGVGAADARALGEAIELLRLQRCMAEAQPQPEKPEQVHELIEHIEESNSPSRRNFFARQLRALQRDCRAQAFAVSWVEGDMMESVTQGASGPRFVRHLQQEAYTALETPTQPNLRDTMAAPSLQSDFSVFGFRYTIACPFSWQSGTNSVDAVLWLGFAPARPPSSTDAAKARAASVKLGREASAFEKLLSLSSRAAEAQEKTEMLAHMSHDIRSPLNNIKAILSLFRLEGLGPDSGEMLETAMKNCESMGEIVEDLLDYSRHRMGKLSSHKSVFPLRTLLSDVIQSFLFAARRKGLQLTFDLGNGDYVVEGDRNQLRRVFTNILSNAIKYTIHGTVDVTVQSMPGGVTVIKIQDTGLGMSNEQLARLFTPFSRFHAQQSEGIGLGLALTKVLLETNGGSINVQSTVGRGSAFSVTLPAAAAHREPVAPALPCRAQSLLLIDDDQGFAESLAQCLRQYRLEVQVAVGVEQALAILTYAIPDAIICDSNMPNGGGKRILNFVSNRQIDAPVIILTGDTGLEEELRSSGAAAVLLKPVDPADIIATLGELCSRTFVNAA